MEEPGRLQSVHGVAKSQTRLSDSPFTFHFHALEKEMATHSSVLAWRIPGTEEPGAQPREEDVEKSQSEVEDRPDPQEIIPMLFHRIPLLSRRLMQPAGQARAHRPQPTHLASSTWA